MAKIQDKYEVLDLVDGSVLFDKGLEAVLLLVVLCLQVSV